MGVKVPATGCLNWSQPSISHSASSPTLSTTISSSLSSKRRSLTYVHRSSFGNKLNRSRSCETLTLKLSTPSIKQIVSATFDSEYNDDEFANEVRELALGFQLPDHDDSDPSSEDHDESESALGKSNQFVSEVMMTNWFENMVPASIERKANSVELPFSLRIIQKKKQWEAGFRGAGEFVYCSMKKAFSSMVFIIRELQSYTLQMREVLFVEDLQGVLMRVQKEMNASFVWLFQQVFSHTPNLMVCVMILLANYSVYSMSINVAIEATPVTATVELVSDSTVADQTNTKLDCSSMNNGASYSANSSGKTTSIGGINGGGGKSRPVGSGTDGEGESVSGEVSEAEEWGLWKAVVAEAEKMREVTGGGGIDGETMRRFVSPVRVKLEEEVAGEDYLKTELHYQTGLVKEPDNPLLLANYAQFLYLFAHDHKRAEEYFKKASQTEPKDAEALFKYASFLWHAKNDLWAAEETFLEAISVDPTNSLYSGTYANFLWSNGADDTCYPLEPS